jgi:hypothetical protein
MDFIKRITLLEFIIVIDNSGWVKIIISKENVAALIGHNKKTKHRNNSD